ncbi:hypothetical protein [Vreelandella venusta]|nr:MULTISPECIES: hypothetical protein [Halomonas]
MHTAQCTCHTQAMPVSAASAWACVAAFFYAAYWFSHGVPLADQ